MSNTLFQLGGQVLHLLLNIIIIAMVARYLGLSVYGKYARIFVLLSFFIILTDFGLNDIVVREIAKDKSKMGQMVRDLFRLKFLMGLAAVGLSVLTVWVLRYSMETVKLFAWASISLMLLSFMSIGQIVFRVQLRMGRHVVGSVVKDVSLLCLVGLVIHFEGGLLHLIWASIAAQAANLAVVMFLMRGIVAGGAGRIDFNLWKDVFRCALPLGLAYLVVALYAGIDTLLLGKMVGDKAVGLYNAAYKFVYQMIFVPLSFVNSIFPVMSGYLAQDKAKFENLFKRSYDYMVLLAIPLAAVITVTAPKLIDLIYGQEYAPSVGALQILGWAVAIMFQSILFGYTMVVLNQQWKSLVINIMGLVVNVALNLILIPRMSFIGAAIATVATELCVLTSTICILRRHMRIHLPWVNLGKAFIIGALCAALLLSCNWLPLFVQLGICLPVYVGLLFVFKAVPRRDFRWLWDKIGMGSIA